jgi:hypothetical protein
LANFAEAADGSANRLRNRTETAEIAQLLLFTSVYRFVYSKPAQFERTRTLLSNSAHRATVVKVDPHFTGQEPSGGVDL